MCIIVDVNALPPVFSENCGQHAEFLPVQTWILRGKGYLVFGGTKFKEELALMPRYLKLVRLLKDASKAYEINQDKVDTREKEIIALTKGESCDDQHIIALLNVSKCILFCSADGRADSYVKDKRFYPKGATRPKIYRSLRNKSLLIDKNIAKLRDVI